MSKYTMRLIIELIVHLYDNYLGILKFDLSYLPYVLYAEYLLLLLHGLNYLLRKKSHPEKFVLFISNQQHCWNTS